MLKDWVATIPGSFAAGDGGAVRTWMELLYLSVAVLSSVGLSDIVPAMPMARALVMIESFVGVCTSRWSSHD